MILVAIVLMALTSCEGPVGPPGPRGWPGANGRDGEAGSQGEQGYPGQDGVDGKDGRRGMDGEDGKDGEYVEREYYLRYRCLPIRFDIYGPYYDESHYTYTFTHDYFDITRSNAIPIQAEVWVIIDRSRSWTHLTLKEWVSRNNYTIHYTNGSDGLVFHDPNHVLGESNLQFRLCWLTLNHVE